MTKSSAGTSPLGHAPLSKVKLEGPKKHHDSHGMDASRPMKGSGSAIPSGHWEKHYSINEPSKNMKATEGSDFSPKCPSDRKTVYLKVNREDH